MDYIVFLLVFITLLAISMAVSTYVKNKTLEAKLADQREFFASDLEMQIKCIEETHAHEMANQEMRFKNFNQSVQYLCTEAKRQMTRQLEAVYKKKISEIVTIERQEAHERLQSQHKRLKKIFRGVRSDLEEENGDLREVCFRLAHQVENLQQTLVRVETRSDMREVLIEDLRLKIENAY